MSWQWEKCVLKGLLKACYLHQIKVHLHEAHVVSVKSLAVAR